MRKYVKVKMVKEGQLWAKCEMLFCLVARAEVVASLRLLDGV